MKKVWGKWMAVVAASFMIGLSVQTSQAQGSVSMQVFYNELQPYGTWINHNNYGSVWMPNVDQGFVPYQTNGYWVNTSYGNTWVSDYSWGWAPFHYGRWFFDDYYGWLWVPDSSWAPAWVAWRSGGGYYGWAPLMPGFGINVSVGYYNRIPHNYWSFVPYRYVMYHNVYRHCVGRPQVVNVINNTTIVNNYYNNDQDRNGRDRSDRSYFTGPSRNDIEQRNHERVPVYDVSDRSRPGRTEVSRTSVSMYKPRVDNSNETRSGVIPNNITRDERNGNDRNGRTGSIDANTQRSTMPQDMRGNQMRESRTNNADRVQRTMPLERDNNSSRTMPMENNNQRQAVEADRFQRSQSNDDAFRQRVERRQSQPQVEQIQRPQNDGFQRIPAQRSPQVQSPDRTNNSNIQRAPQREFRQSEVRQPQRTQSFERSSTPQVQREQPHIRQQQIQQRQVQRSSSASRTREH